MPRIREHEIKATQAASGRATDWALPSTLHSALAYIRLVRPSNSLAASALMLFGARLGSTATPWSSPPPSAGWAAVVMWFITAFGYVSNDLHDVAEDAINNPGRPLQRG